MKLITWILGLIVLLNGVAIAQERKRDPRDLPAESRLIEEVAIELAEVRVLVTSALTYSICGLL